MTPGTQCFCMEVLLPICMPVPHLSLSTERSATLKAILSWSDMPNSQLSKNHQKFKDDPRALISGMLGTTVLFHACATFKANQLNDV